MSSAPCSPTPPLRKWFAVTLWQARFWLPISSILLSAAGLGSQLLRTYDLGLGAEGSPVELTTDRIAAFFSDLLHDKIPISTLDGTFSLSEIVGNLQ